MLNPGFYEPPCARLLFAHNIRTQERHAPTVNAQTALNLVSLLASRTAERSDARSASFCAAEASVRVPLDSLRTCERKCRRLNARGRSSFNCLPLVTRPERAEKRKGEKGDARARARLSWVLLGALCSLFAAVFGAATNRVRRPICPSTHLPLASPLQPESVFVPSPFPGHFFYFEIAVLLNNMFNSDLLQCKVSVNFHYSLNTYLKSNI